MAGIFSLTRTLRSSTFAHARTPFAQQSTRVGLGQARLNFVRPQARPFSAGYSAPRRDAKAHISPIWRAAGVGAVGLGLASLTLPKKAVYCEPPTSSRYGVNEPLPPPPSSSVRPYELTFGTVCGFCAGVFVKKGARALAFMLGGLFVLLQYLGASQIIKPDWSRTSQRFESLFYTKSTDPATGVTTSSPPSIVGIWNRLVNFLTSDFQQRASFMAGLALGLRVG